MSRLLTMPPLRRDMPAEQQIHQRIRARSRILAALFTGLFWAVVGLLAALVLGVLFYRGHYVFFAAGTDGLDVTIGNPPPVSSGLQDLGDLAARYRIGGAFALLVQFAPAVFVLRNLRDLFRLYAAGTVFGAANAERIKRIGLWLIGFALAPFLSVQLLILLDSAIDRAWFHMVELQALMLGAILFVIAQVMEAGRAIEQDRDGFV